MPCYHPIERWEEKIDYLQREGLLKDRIDRETGQLKPRAWIEMHIDQPRSRGILRQDCKVEYIPCNRCIGCKIARAKDWTIRQAAEAKTRERNSCWFLTLTQDENHIAWTPYGPTLVKEDLQRFIKSLQKSSERKGLDTWKHFGCGEYGSLMGRPHYHLNIFGLDIEKEYGIQPVKDETTGKIITSNGSILYTSEKLRKLWDRGHITVARFTPETAAYVASYVTKKIGPTEKKLPEEPIAEFTIKSNKAGGIGKDYYETKKDEIYQNDIICLGKMQVKPPKYYDKLFEKNHHEELCEIKYKRQIAALEAEKLRQQKDSMDKLERLAENERKKIEEYHLTKLRNYENGSFDRKIK